MHSRSPGVGAIGMWVKRHPDADEGSVKLNLRFEGIGIQNRNTTRLETRTKESSGAASRRLAKSQFNDWAQ